MLSRGRRHEPRKTSMANLTRIMVKIPLAHLGKRSSGKCARQRMISKATTAAYRSRADSDRVPRIQPGVACEMIGPWENKYELCGARAKLGTQASAIRGTA